YSDEFQKVSVFVLQTSAAHNDPARPAVRQNETVLRLEDAEGRTGVIEGRVNCRAFVGMDPPANQVAVQRLIGIESVNGASFVTHPGAVLFRIDDPKSDVAAFR